jgi:type 1 glutamine amidotransferase
MIMSRAFAAALAALLLAPVAAQARPKQILFFTKAAGNEHAVIKPREGGQPSIAQTILTDLGAKNGFEVTHSKDGRIFTPEGLAKFDGFVFYTTGDLTTPGVDKNPPMPPEGKQLLLDSVSKGKAFIGIHVASDTFLTPGDRYAANGESTDPYLKMVGGEFIWHGQQQKGRIFCSDPRFPGFADLKDGLTVMEEYYSFKNLSPDLHVLLWLGTWSMMNTGKDSVYRRAPYPLAWARMQGKGRVFYTALGHRDDVWSSLPFQQMLVGGIKWATGLASASVRPNITTVTPYYDEIPPNDAPRPADKGTPAAPAAPAAPAGGTPAAPTHTSVAPTPG